MLDQGVGMRRTSSRRGWWRSGAWLLGVAAEGCASGDDVRVAPEKGADDAIDALLGGSCSESDAPKRYEAILQGEARCEDVTATDGTWLARPLFADAPADIRDGSCRFTWRARSRGAAPDAAALKDHVGATNLLPSCSRGAPPRLNGERYEFDPSDIVPMGGSVGCDVCGVIRRREGFIVRPPNVDRIRFHAALADARGRPVDMMPITVPPTRARSMVVTLPEPPPGLHYVEGRIPLQLR